MCRPLRTTLLISALLLTSVVSSAQVTVLTTAINPATGHTYHLLSNSTWTAAEAMAVTLGGHLTAINDAAEEAWILSTFSTFGGGLEDMWIGFTDYQSESNWVWISGEPVTYTNWYANQPNSNGTPGLEDYCLLQPDPTYGLGWHDYNDAGGGGSRGVVEINTVAPAEYQVNQPGATLDIDGEPGSAYSPTIAARCAGVTSTLNISSTSVGMGMDLAISYTGAVGATTGGYLLPDGQILNLDLATTAFLLTGTLVPDLGSVAFPGTLSVPFAPANPLLLTLQSVHVDPSLPLLIALSGARQVDVSAFGPGMSVPGPAGDDASVTVDVTAPPTCWMAGGISFCGTAYTEIHVASNGRVVFTGQDNDYSPTVAEALTGKPFVGLWADLSPNVAGGITVSSPAAGVVRVDYSGLPYYGQPTTASSYAVEFDIAGTVVISGLVGVQADPGSGLQFLGTSPGLPGLATNAGTTLFTPVGTGAAASPSDMLFDFSASPLPSLSSGLSSIVFVPDGLGNYQWAGL